MLADLGGVLAGSAVGSSSPLVVMGAATYVATSFWDQGDPVDVGLRVNRDGTIDLYENSWSYEEDWLASGLPDATIGDDYEMYWTGDVPDTGPFQTWTTVNSDIEILFTGTEETWSGTLTIREILVTSNNDSAGGDFDVFEL